MSLFLKLHAIAARRGDGLRPELRALMERPSTDLNSVTIRRDGMVQSGPDPTSHKAFTPAELNGEFAVDRKT